MSFSRAAHALFCDDIRVEFGNKLSLMGIYSADLAINTPFPTIVAKFAVIVYLITGIDDKLEKFAVEVIAPDGSLISKSEMPVPEIPGPVLNDPTLTKYTVTQAIVISPLQLPCEGMLEVWVETGRERLRAGRLWIHSVDPTGQAAQGQPLPNLPPH
jgi:hypothetical protein